MCCPSADPPREPGTLPASEQVDPLSPVGEKVPDLNSKGPRDGLRVVGGSVLVQQAGCLVRLPLVCSASGL